MLFARSYHMTPLLGDPKEPSNKMHKFELGIQGDWRVREMILSVVRTEPEA